MSAPRPRRARIPPRQAPSSKVTPKPVPKAPVPRRKAPRRVTRTRQAENGNITGTDQNPIYLSDAPSTSKPSAPVSVASAAVSDDEEDLEEVSIPGVSTPGGQARLESDNPPSTPLPGSTINGTDAGQTSGAENAGDLSDDAQSDDGVIELEIGGETTEEREKRVAMAMRKKPITSKDRAPRLEAHKLHVIALLAAARIRNRWCNNMLLKARLLSLLPHSLQSAFNIPPSRFPDRAQRSRLFFDALQSLATWWSQTFFDISDPTLGMRTRSWDEVQEVTEKLPRLTRGDFFGSAFETESKWRQAVADLAASAIEERLRSVNSLMKKVLQQEGSRDVMAQLFVSLARACGLGVRLVTSLQAVPWRAEKSTPKKRSGAGRNGRLLASRQGDGHGSSGSDEEDDLEEVPIPDTDAGEGSPLGALEKAKRKPYNIRAAGRRRHIDPADVYRLRPARPSKPQPATPGPSKVKKSEDLSPQPPVFWAEVFSRSDQRWIPVDPVRGTIRKKSHFEPVTDTGPIRLLYVVAFEEDGYARDVTLRYAKNFGAKTSKLRVPVKKDEGDWWGDVMEFLQRPQRLNRDELEDAELETSQFSEGMPQHLSGFKDHPVYVLERHLKREEVIVPKREIGRFRGEPVYRRSNVVSCKTAETWMRQGRRIKDKQEPLKWVKQRAVTLQKRRAQELAIQESGEALQQGLYAEWQTEFYIPPPIQDGIIPQNSFGNIDLYAPTMLPRGAVHLPYKGIAKVAKGLGISYAEACTGFEFKKQRAIPVITGIVVAEDNEELVMDAYWESAAVTEERERAKKEEAALKRWVKLINGLRVRARLLEEYGDDAGEQRLNPLADPSERETAKGKSGKKTAAAVIASSTKENQESWEEKARRSPS